MAWLGFLQGSLASCTLSPLASTCMLSLEGAKQPHSYTCSIDRQHTSPLRTAICEPMHLMTPGCMHDPQNGVATMGLCRMLQYAGRG